MLEGALALNVCAVMVNILISVVASVVLLLGLVALISPLPIGVFMIGGSVAVLIMVNPSARALLKRLRGTFIWLNHHFIWLERKLERKFPRIAEAFHLTRPKHPKDDPDP